MKHHPGLDPPLWGKAAPPGPSPEMPQQLPCWHRDRDDRLWCWVLVGTLAPNAFAGLVGHPWPFVSWRDSSAGPLCVWP